MLSNFIKSNNSVLGNKITLVFGAIVVALILVMGIGLLCTTILIEKIPKPNRTYLGLVFIFYASFRAYRIFKSFKDSKTND